MNLSIDISRLRIEALGRSRDELWRQGDLWSCFESQIAVISGRVISVLPKRAGGARVHHSGPETQISGPLVGPTLLYWREIT